MIRTKELFNPNSCLNKAKDDEMLFVLLGRDPAAPVAIRAWVEERIRLGKNNDDDEQIKEALICAQHMTRYRAKNTLRIAVICKSHEHFLQWQRSTPGLALYGVEISGGVNYEGYEFEHVVLHSGNPAVDYERVLARVRPSKV